MNDFPSAELILSIAELLFVIIGGTVLGVLSYRRSVLDAIWQWTLLDGSKEVMDSRRFVQFELSDDYNPDDIRNNVDGAAAKIAPIANAYHHLGGLLKRRYIPLSIFKDDSMGRGVIIIYRKLLPYIERVREEHNPSYASGFEYLYNKVRKYYE